MRGAPRAADTWETGRRAGRTALSHCDEMIQPRMPDRGRHGGRSSEGNNPSSRIPSGQSARRLAGLAVLIGGAALAMLFRDSPTRSVPPGASGDAETIGGSLVLSERIEPARARIGPSLPRSEQPSGAAEPSAAAPADRPVPIEPPLLAKHYPGRLADDRLGPLVARLGWGDFSQPAPARPTHHRIADGDTLATLAERYLGDARRAGELFEANRDVLADPEVLPVGAELRIPQNDRGIVAARVAEVSSGGELVPVPDPDAAPSPLVLGDDSADKP